MWSVPSPLARYFLFLASHKHDARLHFRDGLYHCDYCHRDLSTSLRIKCAVCPDFDLCLECFSVGVEVTPHANDHAYRVVDNLSFPVYTPDWGADEEMLLLEGVELYGLGNWGKVSEHVGKAPVDCSSHYFAVYVETDTFPLPKPAPEMSTLDIRKLIEERRRAGAERIALAKQAARNGRGPVHPAASKSKQHSSGWVQVGEHDIAEEISTNQEDKRDGKTKKREGPFVSKGNGAATPSVVAAPVGDAHRPGAAIPFGTAGGKTTPTADPAAPLILSQAQQTGYHLKRNEFEPDYDHQAEEIIAELDFTEEDSEEMILKKLRLIDIYNRRLDERDRRHEFVLSRGLVNVKRQQAIDRRRAPSERELVGRMRVFARYLPQSQWEALADGIATESRLRARISELQKYRGMGMTTFDEVDAYEAIESKKKREVAPSAQAGKSRLQRIPVDETAMESELAAIGLVHAAAGVHAQHSSVAEGRGADGLQAWRTRRGILLDIASFPDVEPLTQKERQLCALERYLPAQYLAVKAETARMQTEKGCVSKSDVQNLPFKVDKERSGRLYSFFVEQGWVKQPDQ